MQSNRDIYRAAEVLIRQHGSEATLQAAIRAEEMLDQDDAEAAVVWRLIEKAVTVLQNAERTTGSRVH